MMDLATKKRVSEIMAPDEFKRLLDQFGKDALAKAERSGRQRGIEDVIKIIVNARIPAATKEWLLDRCRGLQ